MASSGTDSDTSTMYTVHTRDSVAVRAKRERPTASTATKAMRMSAERMRWGHGRSASDRPIIHRKYGARRAMPSMRGASSS